MTNQLKLTPARIKVLVYLREHPKAHPREVAGHLWPDSLAWNRSYNCGQHGSTRGITMPMRAGVILWQLARSGLAREHRRESLERDKHRQPVMRIRGDGWSLTNEGLRALKALGTKALEKALGTKALEKVKP